MKRSRKRGIRELENTLAKGIAWLLFFIPFYLIVFYTSKFGIDVLLISGLSYSMIVLIVCLIWAWRRIKKYCKKMS